MAHSVLIVTTSTAQAGEGGPETGFNWLSLAVPYWRLREAGLRIGFASIKGGKPPGDPETALSSGERAGAVEMFLGDGAAVEALAQSQAIGQVEPDAWDAVLLTDGLGGLWDLAQSQALATVLSEMWADGGLIATLGAGAAGLVSARTADARSIVAGLRLTALADRDARTNAAARATQSPSQPVIEPPLQPASRLREMGAQVFVGPDGEPPLVIEEGRLITGQDARAAADVTLQLLDALDIYAQPSATELRGADDQGAKAG
ncbi:MAG: DJ-1/PfpI family protein [Pseudomonadota bacterium]